MNAPFTVNAARSINELRDLFAGICERRADLFADGVLTLHEAVDELQAIASLTGLVAAIGQDKVQEIISGSPPLVPDLTDEIEAEIRLRAGAMVRQWELDDPRDRWRHTGEAKPVIRPTPVRREPYAPPASTLAAFRHVERNESPDYLTRWLANHPADAPALYKIWKATQC